MSSILAGDGRFRNGILGDPDMSMDIAAGVVVVAVVLVDDS